MNLWQFRDKVFIEKQSELQWVGGQYEYNERFRPTSVKLEELLSKVGHFLHRDTNQSSALSEKGWPLFAPGHQPK